MVNLVEQGWADQNDVARAFGCAVRTLRRQQRPFEGGGLPHWDTLREIRVGVPAWPIRGADWCTGSKPKAIPTVRSRAASVSAKKRAQTSAPSGLESPLGGKSFAIDLFSPGLSVNGNQSHVAHLLENMKTEWEGQNCRRRGSQHPYCRPGKRIGKPGDLHPGLQVRTRRVIRIYAANDICSASKRSEAIRSCQPRGFNGR